MIIDYEINFYNHVNQVKKILLQQAITSAVSHIKTGINIHTATKIYQAICELIIEYACMSLKLQKTTLKQLAIAITYQRLVTKLRQSDD